ncbi:glycosyltransferase family 39 protein [bacterium]|nr:glycosyltransferase family 39 protein [candidate division CSSED10-310 bacterium]
MKPYAVFFLLNLCAWWSASRLQSILSHYVPFIQAFVLKLTFFISLILISEMILGSLGVLSISTLLTFHIILAGFLTLPCFSVKKTDSIKESIEFNLSLSLQSVVAGVILVVAAIIFVLQSWKLLTLAPFHWDDYTYHFRFPVEWMKTHSLGNPITAFGDLAPVYSPMNSELLHFWVMAPLSSDIICRFLQHLFLLGTVLILWLLLRKIRIPLCDSIVLTISFATIPYLITQGIGLPVEQQISNDIIALFFFALSLYFLFFDVKDSPLSLPALFGLSLGLFIGTKFIGIVFSIPLILFFLIKIRRLKGLHKVYAFSLFTIFSMLTGSYSYLNNVILTGNPFFPATVTIANIQIFKGIYSMEYLKSLEYFSNFSWLDTVTTHGFGLGMIAFLAIVCIGAMGCVLFTKSENTDDSADYKYFSIALPFANALLFYFLIPFRNQRFLLFAVFPVYLVMGYLLRQFQTARILLHIFLYTYILLSLWTLKNIDNFYHVEPFIIGLFLSILLLLFPVFLQKFEKHLHNQLHRLISRLFLWSIISFAVVPWFIEKDLSRDSSSYYSTTAFRENYGPSWNWVREMTALAKTGFRIAYCGTNGVYPLYGIHYQNDVIYVPTNNIGTLPHHYQSMNFRYPSAPYLWLDNLKEYNIDLLVCYGADYSGEIRFPIEKIWAVNFSELFVPVYEDKFTKIYALNDKFVEIPGKPETHFVLNNATITPRELCRGGRAEVVAEWFIPARFRKSELCFKYSMNNQAVTDVSYPSPERTEISIHRFAIEMPVVTESDSYALSATIRDTGGKLLEQINLPSIRIIEPELTGLLPGPMILSPDDNASLTPDTRFAWNALETASAYVVTITMPDGRSGALESKRNDLDLHLHPNYQKGLPPGTYKWHVQARDFCGRLCIPSDEFRFIVSEELSRRR